MNNNPNSDTYYRSSSSIWDGITDVADNAFDGNGDGYATGNADDFPSANFHYSTAPTHADFDDFNWVFDTSDEIDITPPILVDAKPADGAEKVGTLDLYDKERWYAELSKLIAATTLIPNDSMYVHGRYQADDPLTPELETNWWLCLPPDAGGCPIAGTSLQYFHAKPLDANPADDFPFDHHAIEIAHETLLVNPQSDYNLVVTKRVRDLMQNCYTGDCVNGLDSDPVDSITPDPNDPNNGPNSPLGKGCRAYHPNPF